jgi:hypothetical protein
MYRDALGFSIVPFMQRVMNINGFFASIMRTGKKSDKSDGSLPPGVPIPVLPVDYLKIKPECWVGGEGSYICPVGAGDSWGLWFNWSMNNPSNTAVLPSVKGMNPITGQRVNGYDLQDYQDECPVHKKLFSKGRFCTECGFKWPAQNYIAKPNKFFLDGFRTPDGNVRQFYFTEDMAKSVPELVIGKEDTVPAFGFCFFKLKDYRPKWEGGEHIKGKFPEDVGSNYSGFLGGIRGSSGLTGILGPIGPIGISGFTGSYVPPDCYIGSITKDSCSDVRYGDSTIDPMSKSLESKRSFSRSKISKDTEINACYFSAPSSPVPCAMGGEIEEKTSGGIIIPDSDDVSKGAFFQPEFDASTLELPIRRSAEVGVAAGAKIKQNFEKSRHAVEDWESKPAGVIRIYFVFQEEFERYAAAGFNNLEGNKEGYLEGVSVGGSHE